MKKLLALVLALVMTLGLATVGANAAEFADQADISYEEAVSVLSTTGVLGGEGDNKYNPKGELTRAAGAKIIAYLDLGEATAESMPATQVFDDVPSTFWGAKYIAYCANAGYIGGRGDGTFAPDDPLTGYAFGKMLLCVLGYDAELEGFVGNSWQLNVAKLLGSTDINDKVDKAGSAVLTREEAAQYAFNALKADTVEYDTKGTTVNVGGAAQVTVGASKAKAVTDTGIVASHRAIGDEAASGNTVVQLGERLYKGDLRRQSTFSTQTGKPIAHWTWKTSTNIGDYATAADYTYVSGKDQTIVKLIEDKLGKNFNLVNDTTHGGAVGTATIVSRNGAAYTTVAADTGLLTGDVVEVYMDETVAFQVETIAVTRYSADKVTAAVATRTSGGVLQVRVPGVVDSWTDADEVHGYEGLAKDDYVYFFRGNNNTGEWYLNKAESFEGQLTTIKTNSTPYKYVVSGTDYQLNGNVYANQGATFLTGLADNQTPKYNTTYAYYTDANGYIIAAKQVESANTDYVVINDITYATSSSLAGNSRVEARLVRLDGTTEVVKVASIETATGLYSGTGGTADAGAYSYLVDGSNNIHADILTAAGGAVARAANTSTNVQVFTYEVNSDGEYELTYAGKPTDITNAAQYASTTYLKASTGRLGNGIAVNDNTKFVVVNNPGASTLKYSSFTGKNNVPTFTTNVSFAYTIENGVATSVFVYNYGAKTDTGDKVVVLSNGSVAQGSAKDADGKSFSYYLYPVLDGGAVKNQMVTTATMTIGEYSPNYDSNGRLIWTGTNTSTATGGNVLDNNPANVENIFTNLPYLGYSLNGTTLTVGYDLATELYRTSYNCPSDATVVIKDKDDNFTVTTAADIEADDNDMIFVICTNNTDFKVKTLYIVQRDADNANINNSPLDATISNPAGTTWTKTNGTTPTTIGLAAGTAYTTYTSDATINGTVEIPLEASCQIKIETTSFGSNTTVAATRVDSGFTFTATDNTAYYVTVTAQDTSVAYYVITP